MASMTARDIMTAAVTTADPELSIAEFLQRIRKEGFSGLPVVERESGRAVGFVSQNDVLRALAASEGGSIRQGPRTASVDLSSGARRSVGDLASLLARPVRTIMTPQAETCIPETPLAEVCATLVAKRIHRVVVVDGDGRVVGLIATTDLVRRFGEDLKRD